MSRSTDPGHFFQTDASEATRARRTAKSGNKNGDPIVLQSKILDIVQDPFSIASVYIAESAGCIRKVNISSRTSETIYKGPTAPLTSVAIGGYRAGTVFAGCWDKDVWSWNLQSKTLDRRYKGHSDFVKAVVCAKISEKDCLISGGADSKIIVWDVASGEKLHTLRDKTDTMRAVQFLAVDPVDTTSDEVVLVSASSDPKIRRWRLSLLTAEQILDDDSTAGEIASMEAILQHETSVYKLFFDSDEGDLWTASADGTAKCLSRARNWDAEESVEHADYVRAIVVTTDWIVTAGRDEDVKVWDRSTGKLFHVYDGHYEEITGLVAIDGGRKIVSVSIDGTIRTWGLSRADLEKARNKKDEEQQGLLNEGKPAEKTNMLTAEEEAELAELMSDSE